MLTSFKLRVLHLEPTDVCQASCPSCARETDPDFDQSQKHHLTIDQILAQISDDDIRMLDKMFMCGNYGDPAAGRYTLDIYRYFRSANPHIVLGMNTNGAIQNPDWWQELGEIFSGPRDYVVFSIDGLSDTNEIYRRGVNWDKLLDNARSYIGTGASAHWDMLVYQHNEHQIDRCQELARSLGFRWFRAKVSRRPLPEGLAFPVHWAAPRRNQKMIDCHALQEQSIYIDSQGRRSPCCWLGSRQRDFIQDISQVIPTWTSPNPNPVCQSACGVDNDRSSFEEQWRVEVEF